LSEVDDRKMLERVVESLRLIYGVETDVTIGQLSEADAAYDGKRKQYDASSLLKAAARRDHSGMTLVLTARDLYVPGFNYVFGYAPGGVGVVSTARLGQRVWGAPSSQELVIQRIVKECVHEVGHLMGLSHCSNHGCVMSFSNSVIDTDRKGSAPCPECMLKLGRSRRL